ncbi:hypothetical protein CROQUDRAFT_653097 [Cronartium quercuum f. sp. fusiforme G11]|uniref:Uncharacterized protein n=1 Tax=Cronartium quercuum f. sp. fusiforme G11 TaxID=708437 RepID=A0A9P6NPS6_9BASI|nr:hypothetical protein CROQUDRAFT_653097 [Cronartium quercuum f. sp. fusiforme G11]
MSLRPRRTVFPPGPPHPTMVHANISPDTGVEFGPEVTGLDEEMKITMLGAGQEVGRSCCVIEYKSTTVVCDTGVHPAFTGMAALPFIDEIDWSTVDAILITHFHLDHAASLTYIMEHTNFKEGHGKVFMTHPTKAVYRFLMQDFVRMSSIGTDGELFNEEQMALSYESINAIDYHQEISLGSLRFTSYPAGHVLGAAMFLIEIGGIRVLYTGDYSTEEDRHLIPARVPNWTERPDVMICESTYGVQSLEPRPEKEERFTALVQMILKRGGRVLMPVFALGRAQELLLVLDEFWSQHPELNMIPIYYISNLAAKCMKVYQTFIHGMNEEIKQKFNKGINPWTFYREGKGLFKKGYVTNLKTLDKFDDRGPCVLVHGELNNMTRLRNALKDKYLLQKNDMQIHTPRNVETLRLKFQASRIARAIGTLAEINPLAGESISGILVSKDAAYTLLAPSDLREYTGLSTSTIFQRQTLVISVGWETVRWHLKGMYGGIEEGVDLDGRPTFRVMETVDVKMIEEHQLILEWVGSVNNDMIADSVLALLLGIDRSPASLKLTSGNHSHHHHHHQPHHPKVEDEGDEGWMTRVDRLIGFLDGHFGNVELLNEPPRLKVWLDDNFAEVWLDDLRVESEIEAVKNRVSSVVELAIELVTPLSEF